MGNQQVGNGPKQDNLQKAGKDQDMNKKKSEGSCGSCSTGSKASSDDDSDDVETNRMDNEGDVAGTFEADKKNKKGRDANQAV